MYHFIEGTEAVAAMIYYSLIGDHFHVFIKQFLDEVLTGCVPGAGGAVLPVCEPWCGSAVQSEPHL